jgi:lipopolysaccharide export system permease protein
VLAGAASAAAAPQDSVRAAVFPFGVAAAQRLFAMMALCYILLRRVRLVIISRYLTREVLNITLVITGVLIFAFLCQQGIRYLNYVAIGKVPAKLLLLLLTFEVPYLIALLMPLGLFLGILLVFGRFQISHEMAILKMCGFGQLRLMRTMITLASAMALFILVLMTWFNPWLSSEREKMTKMDNPSEYLAQTIMPGRFQVSPDGRFVMYVGSLSRDRKWVKNVFLAQGEGLKNSNENNQFHWGLINATEGSLQPDPENPGDLFFFMQKGYRYDGIPGQKDFKIVQFKKYVIRIPSQTPQVAHQADEALPTFTLFKQYEHPHQAAELQWRLSIALSPFLLTLLAVSMSALHRSKSQFVMILPGILFYIIYMNLLFIARRWVDQGVLPISLGIWWVHGLLCLAILVMIWLYERNKL